VDGDDIGRIACGKLRRQLVIARPLDRRDGDMHVRIVGVELVDQRGDDAALADGLADIGVGAEVGVAGAEEALHGELRRRKGRCRADKRDHRRRRQHVFPQGMRHSILLLKWVFDPWLAPSPGAGCDVIAIVSVSARRRRTLPSRCISGKTGRE
jgi:hypothetical protein